MDRPEYCLHPIKLINSSTPCDSGTFFDFFPTTIQNAAQAAYLS